MASLQEIQANLCAFLLLTSAVPRLKPTATERLGEGGEGLKEATSNQARTKKGRRSKLLRFGFEGK
jgi:hypothetical protein